MRLIVVSGRSGSGKSTALNVLEDVGFTCIDNLPINLLPVLYQQANPNQASLKKMAVSIDARNQNWDLSLVPAILRKLESHGVTTEVLFLDARDETLIQRFSETRRKHPLTSDQRSMADALALESKLLDPLSSIANRHIDTSNLNLHQLRNIVRDEIYPKAKDDMAILFQSFAFKRGVPADADFVFDVRCLPNPHWDQELRPFCGNDPCIIEFLEQQPEVHDMYKNILGFLKKWTPQFQNTNRSYLTIAIGCTGGKHRSVYMSNRLAKAFEPLFPNIQVRHRELI